MRTRLIFLLVFYVIYSFGQVPNSKKESIIIQVNGNAKISIDRLAEELDCDYKTLSKSLSIYQLFCDYQLIEKTILQLENLDAINVQHNLTTNIDNRQDDPYFYLQWQLSQSQGNRLDVDIDIEDAWRITNDGYTLGGDTIVIAIIDEGINMIHEDLVDVIWRNHGEIPENGLDDDNNGYIDDYYGWNTVEQNDNIDNNGIGHWHGTPVAGIIGAKGNNGKGISGINRTVQLLSVVKGKDISSIIEAYDYILTLRRKYNESDGKEGALVVAINCSWGKELLAAEDNPVWCSIYDDLGKEGILSVVAAPNSYLDLDVVDDMPSDCSSDFIISVTNTDTNDQLAPNAAYGEESVDIGAPGYRSFTTSNDGLYNYFGGTSAATPIVSGTIGLLYSLSSTDLNSELVSHPDILAKNIKQSILDGAERVYGINTVSGGRLNVMNTISELSHYYGLEIPEFSNPFEVLGFENVSSANRIFVIFSLRLESDISYQLLDLSGRELFSKDIGNIGPGIHRIEIGEYLIANGPYIISWSVSNSHYSTKVVKY